MQIERKRNFLDGETVELHITWRELLRLCLGWSLLLLEKKTDTQIIPPYRRIKMHVKDITDLRK